MTCRAFGLLACCHSERGSGQARSIRGRESRPGDKGMCLSPCGGEGGAACGVPDLLSFDRLPLFKIAFLAYIILLTNVTPINLI